LAITAATLALLGFDIYCACYSECLSERDRIGFADFFISLGVSEKIKYGTFNKLSEEIINENGAIRTLVENIITNQSNEAQAKVLPN
jgi:hypothetical protein